MMNKRDEIRRLARKIGRDRKIGLFLSPLILGLFGFNAWWRLRMMLAHFQQLLTFSIPEETTPDLVRIRTLSDVIPMVIDSSHLLIALAVFTFLCFKLIVPDRTERLVLLIADELEMAEKDRGQQANAGAVASRRA